MIIMPCLPVFFAGGYLTNIFLLAFVAIVIVLLTGSKKK